MFKNFFSVLCGLFSAFFIVLMFEKLWPLLFHVSPFDTSKNAGTMSDYIDALPVGLLLCFALTYGLASFVGSYVTHLISGVQNTGMIMTIIFFIVVLINFLSFHHPVWMVVTGCIVTILGGYFGSAKGGNSI